MTVASDISLALFEIERVSTKVVKAVALESVSELVSATPVDTSWARNNWVPSIGKPVESPAGSPDNVASASAAQSQGQALVLTTYSLSQGPVFISNNVPYIRRLNDGHSQQAPAGFVQAAIRRAARNVGRRRRV